MSPTYRSPGQGGAVWHPLVPSPLNSCSLFRLDFTELKFLYEESILRIVSLKNILYITRGEIRDFATETM
jgi:hypothetical protein